jgi:hypothetical protein
MAGATGRQVAEGSTARDDETDQAMSLTPCVHGHGQLPVARTCAERCEGFPGCLPPASPQLKTSISGSFQAGAVERATIAVLLAMLEGMIRGDDRHS